jgi:hypothetical protein
MTRQDFRLLTAPVSLAAPMSPSAPRVQTAHPRALRPLGRPPARPAAARQR